MSNFTARLIVSLILTPIILGIVVLGGWYFNSLLFIILVIGIYEIFLIKKFEIKILMILFFLFFLYIFYFLRIIENNFQAIFICLFVTWSSDIGGFVFGKILGGKKINIISPNKTYFGFFGALLLPQILNIYFFREGYFTNVSNNYYFFFIFYLSVAAVLGDLFFSYMKRVVNIKDYSRLIPGHGGLFDRIDGLIFVTILFFLLTSI